MRNARNLRHLNLNLCFTRESKSPPMSPTATQHQNQSPQCPSPSSIMIKNFNSLYVDPTLTFQDHYLSTTFDPEPADFATACASQRFFFSSPGRSNSLIEYSNNNTNPHSHSSSSSSLLQPEDKGEEKKETFFDGSVAVPTYSPDPYLDFRRSMQEMVEARPELMKDVKSNWNVLHELLLCYLALNPKSTHKFILGAFADLLVSLMPY